MLAAEVHHLKGIKNPNNSNATVGYLARFLVQGNLTNEKSGKRTCLSTKTASERLIFILLRYLMVSS